MVSSDRGTRYQSPPAPELLVPEVQASGRLDRSPIVQNRISGNTTSARSTSLPLGLIIVVRVRQRVQVERVMYQRHDANHDFVGLPFLKFSHLGQYDDHLLDVRRKKSL